MNFKHPELVYLETQVNMEFDVYLISLSVAFEYQGEQHYQNHFIFGSPEKQRERDQEKRRACEAANITLIEIPYWWER